MKRVKSPAIKEEDLQEDEFRSLEEYSCNYTESVGKRPKVSEPDSEEDFNPSAYQGRIKSYHYQRRAAAQKHTAERPWIISQSTNRLHEIEEISEELQNIDLRTEQLVDLFHKLSKDKRRLLSKLETITETQLQEQLSQVLSKYQEQILNPSVSHIHVENPSLCVDCRGTSISFQDLVEVETCFTEDKALARVLQTLENNIALVRVIDTGKIVGVFGSRLRVVEE